MKITQIVAEVAGQQVMFQAAPHSPRLVQVKHQDDFRIYENKMKDARACYAWLNGHHGTEGDAQVIVAIFNALAG